VLVFAISVVGQNCVMLVFHPLTALLFTGCCPRSVAVPASKTSVFIFTKFVWNGVWGEGGGGVSYQPTFHGVLNGQLRL